MGTHGRSLAQEALPELVREVPRRALSRQRQHLCSPW